ncbi:alpha/beta hydrolase [Streptomyces sp. HNM0663]|uniref:Alpha/beta hydrolase n=1 Tax=Streptomyces chengmaiensis TaxID=3040919 RepID=A0ABT6HTJ6_9ACTN|nr:alpha/beta hydrolase [Streptomyces chengmaiensis]MDH2392051.1 alpha/beta hydrolase [Streptomyces chengmaiensis]
MTVPAIGEAVAPFPLPYSLHGSGPHKIIAVHGWLADRADYAATLPDLDRESFTYVFVDLRGYGEARATAGQYSTAEGAADIVALADGLGWQTFSLIGHSMGASVAQRVLAVSPERVRRLVGVSPVPACGLKMPPDQWELFASAAEKPENRRLIIDLTTGSRRPAAWLDRMVYRSQTRTDPKAFRAWLDSWACEDFRTKVEGVRTPALAVTGALDPAITAALMRQTWMRCYPEAELAELDCAGHHAMDETPLQLVRTVEDFLRADG